jgi:large subunit ribosomal protein L25
MAEQTTLRAETGRPTGSRPSRRIRKEGAVPAVIYGRGIDPISVTVDHHDLMAIIAHGGSNAVITLDLGTETHVTMPKVVERHPYRNLIRHVDFLKISLTETTTADVPIHLVGEPIGGKEGGILTQSLTTVTVEALPTAIPQAVELDVSGLGLHDSATVADLPPVPGVEYLDDPETAIATVTVPRGVEEAEVEAEAAEGEEAGEAEGGEAEGGD